ncbi:MAG: GNAT family N-acetyltransferase [Candidatus Woesearchaeota archaeon]
MKNRSELETLIKTHFSKLPISTENDSITFRQEAGATYFMYVYDGPVYSRTKGCIDFRVNDDTLYLDGIYINYNLRKRGYGRKAVEIIEAVAKELNLKDVLIESSINDSFWQHMGYSESLFRRNYVWRKQISGDTWNSNMK